MIEVEVKIRISNPSAFREKARKIAKFIGKEKKIDDYYTLESIDHYPEKSLRIRKRKDHYDINFKNRLSYNSGIFAKNEVEFQVSDISHFLALIENFGFKKWLTKEKITEVYQISKHFHIELNHVKSLGYFAEVEYLALPNEVKSARKKVKDVLKALNVSKKDIVKEGYTKMLWNKKKKPRRWFFG